MVTYGAICTVLLVWVLCLCAEPAWRWVRQWRVRRRAWLYARRFDGEDRVSCARAVEAVLGGRDGRRGLTLETITARTAWAFESELVGPYSESSVRQTLKRLQKLGVVTVADGIWQVREGVHGWAPPHHGLWAKTVPAALELLVGSWAIIADETITGDDGTVTYRRNGRLVGVDSRGAGLR